MGSTIRVLQMSTTTTEKESRNVTSKIMTGYIIQTCRKREGRLSRNYMRSTEKREVLCISKTMQYAAVIICRVGWQQAS